jgi:hypothetical protein
VKDGAFLFPLVAVDLGDAARAHVPWRGDLALTNLTADIGAEAAALGLTRAFSVVKRFGGGPRASPRAPPEGGPPEGGPPEGGPPEGGPPEGGPPERRRTERRRTERRQTERRQTEGGPSEAGRTRGGETRRGRQSGRPRRAE